jgi:hypothetical protein
MNGNYTLVTFDLCKKNLLMAVVIIYLILII